MADIKNIITGTISNIFGKVKEVADSTDVKATVSDVKGTVKDIYDQGSSKVKAYGQIAKLSLELTGDKNELNKLYTEIGRLYFEETAQPDDFFAPLFEQTREVYQRIVEKEALIGVLKEAECGCDDECCCEGEDCCCEGEDCCCEGEDCCCEGEDCCCEGEDCCCEEGIEVEVCEFEDVVEACEAEAVITEEAPAEEAPVQE